MIRFINCVRKRNDISEQEFREFWNSEKFDGLRNQIVAITGASKSLKLLTLKIDANKILMQDRGTGEPFDGTVEYFWNDAASLMDIYDTGDAMALMREMKIYQEQFVDMSNSVGFFTES